MEKVVNLEERVEKFAKQQSLFPEHHFQIEVVGDVAILRELLPQSMPLVLCSGSKLEIIDKLSDLMR